MDGDTYNNMFTLQADRFGYIAGTKQELIQ